MCHPLPPRARRRRIEPISAPSDNRAFIDALTDPPPRSRSRFRHSRLCTCCQGLCPRAARFPRLGAPTRQNSRCLNPVFRSIDPQHPNRIDSSVSSIQRTTLASGLGLISSEMTLVSSRNPFTDRWPCQNPVSDPDQYRNRGGEMPQKTGQGFPGEAEAQSAARIPRREQRPQPPGRASLPVEGHVRERGERPR